MDDEYKYMTLYWVDIERASSVAIQVWGASREAVKAELETSYSLDDFLDPEDDGTTFNLSDHSESQPITGYEAYILDEDRGLSLPEDVSYVPTADPYLDPDYDPGFTTLMEALEKYVQLLLVN